MAKRSPLSPGAYGKPQRWHEILTDAADARAVKREQRREAAKAAEATVLLSAGATVFLIPGSST